MSLTEQDAEDILSESLEFLGGKPVIDDSIVRYGPLVLTLAPKGKPKANTLLADHLFSPALFLAERIERGLLDVAGKTVIELGAGSALPSLLLSTRPNPPSLVVVTDYPDDGILGNLRKNVDRNSALVTMGCTVKLEGYDWGTDPSKLLAILNRSEPTRKGYDVVILSDLLHFFTSHDMLVSSISMLLARTEAARAYVGAGNYTHTHVCDNFFEKGRAAGLHFDEISDESEGKKWLGTLPISNLDNDALGLRKNNCRYWVARWSHELS
ncbi:hypothetical protein GALMADRAFT_62054 [Galerina marginata CBS 339.88]|uniref:Uncharacterized protein n=1 Tax=Galerina marginata (strain CBS 339.88) TaxID=685588 RepID=A0A067TCC5_GALM3|nr:hypothetical protein GALMADRAFT_62054 [Galerina marginata CBS 339.88]